MKARLHRGPWEPLLAWTVAVGLALFLTPNFRAVARRWEARPA